MKATIFWIPRITLGLIIVIIGILSLMPPESGLEIKQDKLGHFLAYYALASNALFVAADRRQMLLSMLLTIGYGVILECFQGWIPGRDLSLLDVLANTTGAFLGLGIHLLTYRTIKTWQDKFFK